MFETEELQHERVLDEIGGFFHDLPLGGEAADFFLVPAEGEALVEGAGNLALKLAHAPLVGSGLDLVEAALVRGFDGEKFDVVGPAEGEAADDVVDGFDQPRGKRLGSVSIIL